MSRSCATWVGVLLLVAGCSSVTRYPAGAGAALAEVPVAGESAAARPPLHLVLLIHGIGGNKTHFGEMQAALTRALPAEEPGTRFAVLPFEYETRSDVKTVPVFARELAEAVHRHFTELGGARPGDRLSFVMHSQGGLIGLYWLLQAFGGDPAFFPQYASHFDAYLTLATPYWGAKVATFAELLKRNAGELVGGLPFGHLQLRDMSLGSDALMAFRDRLLDPAFAPVLERIRGQVRPLNVGAVTATAEDDTAVPLPCARLDFIQGRGGYDEPLRFSETGFSRFLLVRALHVSPFPEQPSAESVVQVPDECVEKTDCDHPSFRSVVRHLLRQPVPADESVIKGMHSFLLYVNVRLPDGPGFERLKGKDVKVRFPSWRDNGLRFWRRPEVRLRPGGELYARGRVDRLEQNLVRFFFMGTVSRSYLPPEQRAESAEFADRELSFSVNAPGLPIYRGKARVRASTTTFVDLDLRRVPGH